MNDKYKIKYLKYKLGYLHERKLLSEKLFNKIMIRLRSSHNNDILYRDKYKKYKNKYNKMVGGKGKMGGKGKGGGGGEDCGMDKVGIKDKVLGFLGFFGPIYYIFSRMFNTNMISSTFKGIKKIF